MVQRFVASIEESILSGEVSVHLDMNYTRAGIPDVQRAIIIAASGDARNFEDGALPAIFEPAANVGTIDALPPTPNRKVGIVGNSLVGRHFSYHYVPSEEPCAPSLRDPRRSVLGRTFAVLERAASPGASSDGGRAIAWGVLGRVGISTLGSAYAITIPPETTSNRPRALICRLYEIGSSGYSGIVRIASEGRFNESVAVDALITLPLSLHQGLKYRVQALEFGYAQDSEGSGSPLTEPFPAAAEGAGSSACTRMRSQGTLGTLTSPSSGSRAAFHAKHSIKPARTLSDFVGRSCALYAANSVDVDALATGVFGIVEGESSDQSVATLSIPADVPVEMIDCILQEARKELVPGRQSPSTSRSLLATIAAISNGVG